MQTSPPYFRTLMLPMGLKRGSGTPLLLRLASRTSMCLRGTAGGPTPPPDVEKTTSAEATVVAAGELSSSYYPVYLPMDQDFKAKYMWHHRNLSKRGHKTVKERCYLFLEHPTGWICFIYHMSV